VTISMQEYLDLLGCEPPVYLFHDILLALLGGMYHERFTFQAVTVHFSGVNSSLFNFS